MINKKNVNLALDIFIIIVFIILLAFALYLYIQYFLCDNYTCKAYTMAADKTQNEQERMSFLVNNLGGHSIWPLAYIASSIITFFVFWLLNEKPEVKKCLIIFLISFITIYFLISFFFHHYLKPMTFYVDQEIKKHCNF